MRRVDTKDTASFFMQCKPKEEDAAVTVVLYCIIGLIHRKGFGFWEKMKVHKKKMAAVKAKRPKGLLDTLLPRERPTNC